MSEQTEVVQPNVKHIKRGRKYREGHGIGRSWYYWECEICDGKTEWFLNEEAMKRSSIDHKRMHDTE